MIEVYLYGDMCRYASGKTSNGASVINLPVADAQTVSEVLRQVGIKSAEVGHIFLNGQLLYTQSRMAPWLGYTRAEERVPVGSSHFEVSLCSGDRVGVFPTGMSMLVV